MHSWIRGWPRCFEFTNSGAKNMSCPYFLLGKHERLALNLNATFLSFVVRTISSVLSFLASWWMFGLLCEVLKSFLEGQEEFFVCFFKISRLRWLLRILLVNLTTFSHTSTLVDWRDVLITFLGGGGVRGQRGGVGISHGGQRAGCASGAALPSRQSC